MRLFYLFPLGGPINGVKVIAGHILENFKNTFDEIVVVDTSQAKDYSSFGNFNFTKIFSFFKIIYRLRRITKNDIAYLNFSTKGFSLYRDTLILKFLIYKKCNTTIHVHANGLEDIKSSFIKKLLNNVKIIVINGRQKKLLDYKNVYLVHNSLPDYYNGKFSPSVRPTPSKLLFMSNLSEEKGVSRIVEICEEIVSQKVNFSITICGGILDKVSHAVLQHILSKYKFVTYLGPITDLSSKMSIYNEHDFLLFLSKDNYEVYPLVYIEALMNGLPVITTQQVVTHEIIDEGRGLLIKKNNFVEFILNSANPGRLHALKIANRTKYEEDFNFQKFCDAIHNIVVYEPQK